MSTDPQPDGPCGCIGMHPHESHAAHVDGLWRRQNAALLERMAELEQARLAAKRVWLTREAGR